MTRSIVASGMLARFFQFLLPRRATRPGADGRVDPRTIVFAVVDGPGGKSLYHVINDWAAEKVRTKRVLLRAVQDGAASWDSNGLHDAHACDFGVWLRFAVVPPELGPVLADLRMWHTVWHEATDALCDEIRAGHFEKAVATMRQNRAGSWWYASRKVDRLLQKLAESRAGQT